MKNVSSNTNTMPVTVGALNMIKKEINTLTKYQVVSVNMKYNKFHFDKLLIFLDESTIKVIGKVSLESMDRT